MAWDVRFEDDSGLEKDVLALIPCKSARIMRLGKQGCHLNVLGPV